MVVGALVGRGEELATLTEALSEAKRGRGSVHLLTGEGGVGKTRLTAAVAALAREQGFSAVTGRAFPVETGIPYALFADGFVPLLREMPPATLQTLTRGGVGELALLFPTLRGEGAAAPRALDASDLKARLLDTFGQLLGRLAQRQPMLVVLENLHWADPSSIDLFHFVARAAPGQPLVLLATYNDSHPEVSRGLRAAEGSLASLGVLARHALSPLTRDETDTFIRAGFDAAREDLGDFAERVHARTRGNPFFIEETLKALVQEGRLRREGDRWVGWTTEQLALPDGIREALRIRYERLSEGARRLTQVAAVAGTHVPHRLLERLGGLDAATLVTTIEELLRERVLEETEGAAGPAYLFTHPMLQEMLYAELSRVRQRQMHGEIGEALEAGYGERALAHAQELAVHFRRADATTFGARALRYLAEAGRLALERGANREAVESLEAARTLLDADGDHPLRAEVLGSLARARSRLGEYAAASRIWQGLLREAEARDDPAGVAALERRLGIAAARGGDATAALAHLDRGVAAAERAADAGVAAGLHLARAGVLLEHGRAAEVEVDVHRALAIAEPLGDASLLARAHQTLQSHFAWQGPVSLSMEHGERALAFARQSGDDRVAWSVEFTRALLAGLTGDAVGTVRHLEAAHGLAEAARSPLMRLWTVEVAIEYHSGIGAWDEALRLAGRAIEEARAFRQRLLLPRLLTWTAMIHLGRGDFTLGKSLVDEAWQLSGADRADGDAPLNVHTVVPAHVGLGFYHYYREDWRTALEIAERGLAIADRTGITVWAAYRLLPLVAECHMRLYDWDEARGAARRMREVAERLGHVLARVWADTIDALEMRFTGDRRASIERLHASVEALEAIPYAEHAARLRRRLAEPYIELKDIDGAAQELRLAFQAFAKLGAVRAMQEVRERMIQIGVKPPPVPPPKREGLAALTPQELAVAREIATGKTNKEAGAALGISDRTVGTHLANAYKKLAIHGKVELAAWLRERDRAAPGELAPPR